MKTLLSANAIALISVITLAGSVRADPPVKQASQAGQEVAERTVFVTGSLIPQRIQLRSIGTTTFSPIRIIDRAEINRTGRQTTAGAFVNEPSVRVIGH